jgi:hypothetical protein
MDNELLILLTENWDNLPDSLKEKLEADLREDNRLTTLATHGRCFACGSENRYQYGVEIICDDCGYTREDYSND